MSIEKDAAEVPRTPNGKPAEHVRDLFYTYADVAALLRVSERTAIRYVKQGKVPSPIYVGTLARFTAEAYRVMGMGIADAGTFSPLKSPRAVTAKRAREERENQRARRVSRKKITKQTPTHKTNAAKVKKGGDK